MKTNRLIVLALCILVMFILINSATYASGEKLIWKDEWPTKIRIGTATIGGGFYMGGSALANVLKEEFPELEVIVEQTKAAVHNIKLIEDNQLEFAMATTNTTYQGWLGEGAFEPTEYKGFRTFMPAWAVPMTFVTLKSTGITNIKDFTGKFSGITKGSATNEFVRKTFEALGVKAKVINLGIADTVQAIKNGIISGYSIGYPNPATQDLSIQRDTMVFGMTGEDAEIFKKLYPEYTYPLTIPGGYYKGIDEPIDSIGFYDVVITRDDLPEDMIYTCLKAMYKHQDVIEATWPLFAKGMSPDFVKVVSAPIHKGSLKYFREVGAEIPEIGILDE